MIYSSREHDFGTSHARCAVPAHRVGLAHLQRMYSPHASASREPLPRRARTLLKLAELARAQARRGAAALPADDDGKGAIRPRP